MTSGGIFTLIANDGKADNLIYATRLLNSRIEQIKTQNAESGNDDNSPTLSEIEKTHMLFVNAHFKPFVMIGFEYMKARPTTAGTKLNVDSTTIIKYNIPQYGDFFSDMALDAKVKNVKDDGKYKYKAPHLNGYHPVWKLCTRLKNGEEHVNFAVNYKGGTSTGSVVNTTHSDGSVYNYKVYNRPSKNMAWVEKNAESGDRQIVSDPTASDMAVLAMTCFVDNPNDLGVDVSTIDGTQRLFPFEMPEGSQNQWTAITAADLPSGSNNMINNNEVGGWAEIENIWIARGYVITGGLNGSNGRILYNLSTTGNIRQSTGFLYYYGTGDEYSEVKGYEIGSIKNTVIHQIATANGQLDVINSSGQPYFGDGMYVKIDWVESIVDEDGAAVPVGQEIAGGSKWAKKLRFAQNPGHRLLKDVKFTVNNNILDQYNTEVYNMYEKFFVSPNKKTGYHKLIGQQQAMQASASNVNKGVCQVGEIVDGNQVGKDDLMGTHHFWIPLLFWFSKDFHLSVPSVSIPFGQRNIDVTLASLKELVYAVPANVYKVHKTKFLHSKLLEQNKRALYFGNALDAAGTVNYKSLIGERNPIKVDVTKIQVDDNDYDTSVKGEIISNDEIDIDLYINNLFVTPEIHDIFIKRVGFNLIRVHVQQEMSLTAASNELLLSNLKWPIEYLLLGVKPNINRNDPDNWHRYEVVNRKTHPIRYSGTNGDSVNMIKYDKHDTLLDSFGIKAHGVSLFDDTYNSKFYNAYLPWKYGKDLVTPTDDGVYMINFCLYPGDYQPSGHINVSRAREFYFKYNVKSEYDPSAVPSTLYIIASAINFLLISDGSAVLRYTT